MIKSACEVSLMKAGFSKIDITPPLGIVMGGHPGIKKAGKIIDRLYSSSMAISDGNTTVIFSSADLLFVGNDSVKRIKKAVSDKLGIKEDNLFISATHTHSGPLTTGLFGRTEEGEYVKLVESRIAESMISAANNLEDTELFTGHSMANNLSFCARYIMKEGKVETHPFKYDEDMLYPEDIVDEELIVLFSKNKEEKITGLLVNYANHPQVMERENDGISADFPAAMAKYIKKQLGEDVNVQFVNGACGDICPVNASNANISEIGENWCNLLGERLALKVFAAIEKAVPVIGDIYLKSTNFELALRDIPKEKLNTAKEFLRFNIDNVFTEPPVSNYGTESPDKKAVSLEEYLKLDCWKMQEYRDILSLSEKIQQSPDEKVNISALSIGELCIVTLPFEMFTRIGLITKEKSPFKRTAVFELTNGNAGYLPTKSAFGREGGYETLTLCSSRFEEAADEKVLYAIIKLLEELKGE
jgi:neutral ceramidase